MSNFVFILGSGRTEKLSDLFQDKTVTDTQNDSADEKASKKDGNKADDNSQGDSAGDDVFNETSDREIVDILLAADLGLIHMFIVLNCSLIQKLEMETLIENLEKF